MRLDESKKPNSFYCASDPTDVARVEDRTYICSVDEKDAGPTNNWMAPGRDEGSDDRALPRLHARAARCTSSRSSWATSTPTVADVRRRDHRLGLRRRLDARHGPLRRRRCCAAIEETDAGLRPGACTRSAPRSPTARPTSRGRAPTRSTSSTSPRSARSGATAPATAATPCSARSATRCASPRRSPATRAGWPSTCSSSSSPRPRGRSTTSPAPSRRACGKTNLAMITPTLHGWKAEMVGDDIAWMRFGEDGRLYAVNPEFGLFGVAPGTGELDQPERDAPPSRRATRSSPTSPSPTTATSGGRA